LYKFSGDVNFEILGHLRRAGCATKVRRVRKAFRITEEIIWSAARVRKAGDLYGGDTFISVSRHNSGSAVCIKKHIHSGE